MYMYYELGVILERFTILFKGQKFAKIKPANDYYLYNDLYCIYMYM